MNLLVKKFGPLAVILLCALVAISCEDPGKIGLIVNSDNGVISTHYHEMVMPASMVQFDPRKTSESRSIQAGKYTNPDFGVVTSITNTQLSLNIIISPQETAQFKSFEVDMSFFSLMGDDPINNVNQTISIYQLAEEIDTTKTYTRVDVLNRQPTPLGDWAFAPKLNDTLQTDSIYTIPLDNAVGQDLFDKLLEGSDIFDSEGAFNAYFKGIALVPTLSNSNIFQIEANKIIFRINYNEFNSDGTPIDRSYEMGIANNGFYHLESDKTGTPISGIAPDNSTFTPTDDYVYLQYGTLMAIKVDLTPFYALSDTLDNMVINKAELSIGEVKQYPGLLEPPAFLEVYFTDESNIWPAIDNIGRYDTTQVGTRFIMLQDESALIPIPPGLYIAPLSTAYEENKYKVQMSVYFQNLYSEKFHSVTEPFLEEKAQIFIFGETSVINPQKSLTHATAIPMAVHKDSIRLSIHYTILTEETNN
jgi:hypothetical protein